MLPLKDLSNCIRILVADAVEKAKSGHPGMPLGMSDIMTVLIFDFLKFNPNDPKWFNRDRLILSNGHGSMLLYAFYYLTGYRNFGLDEIKNFRQLHSKAAGHPENHIYEAIETTTGPLGQGLANAVGMAIAQKKYAERFGKKICDYKIYVVVGDGCLMEGISYESASLAGHLGLDNLVIIFDDNNISIDGETKLSVSENHLAKFESMGFAVDSADGHDFIQIKNALKKSFNATKPSFIAFKTKIGFGTNLKAGSEKSHGSPLGEDEINYLKDSINFPKEPFKIKEELLDLWRKSADKNIENYNNWQVEFDNLDNDDKNYISGKIVNFQDNWYSDLEIIESHDSEATRVISGKIIQKLAGKTDKIIFGSADLASSNNILGENNKAINAQNFSGNFIYYGVREHAMGAIMNGLALSGFLPISGTFFVFSDYMRPAIRLAAIMGIQAIYVMTHDSIAVGEDGPTHQPIEHLASFRAMPGIKVFRPCNLAETIECYKDAMSYQGPSIIALSRQKFQQINSSSNKELYNFSYGAYIISEAKTANPDIIIFSSGSEVAIGHDVQQILEKSHNISCRLVSVPCFENIDFDHLNKISTGAKLKIAIEAASSFGWHKIIGDNSMFFGLDQFGLSAPSDILYEHFGLTADKITQKILSYINTTKAKPNLG